MKDLIKRLIDIFFIETNLYKHIINRAFLSKDSNVYIAAAMNESILKKRFDVDRLLKDPNTANEIAMRMYSSNDLMDLLLKSIHEPRKDLKTLKIIEQISLKFFSNISFSQTGEDIIVDFIFKQLKIDKPSYIDIGTYQPFKLNNTALFYMQGSRGINIEPNPTLFKEIEKYRTEDKNLNVGVHQKKGVLDYYEMEHDTLNTFSKETADNYVSKDGHKIKEIKKISVTTLTDILDENTGGKFPDFMSLDAEGVDSIILKSIDFSKNYPKVICVETISYSTKGRGVKDTDLIDFIKSNGYIVFADTYINTIFVRSDIWFR